MSNIKAPQDFETSKIIEDLYGTSMLGHVGLWNKQTKQTKWFDATSLGQLVLEIERTKNKQDLYLCVSTQKEKLPTNKRGSADSVAEVTYFFADIDFADDKDTAKNYPPNEDTALKILNAFPYNPSLVQRSGNGLHAIWFLDKRLVCNNRKERRRAAAISNNFQKKIVNHYKSHGYEIDNVGDIMRLFRVPGTFNHKSNPPKPVEVIEYNPNCLVNPDEFEQDSDNPRPDNTDETYLPKSLASHDQIKKKCGYYGHITGDGAKDCGEPEWVAGISITSKCKNGNKIFHDYSSTHKDYDYKQAEAKYQHVSKNSGPWKCVTIQDKLGSNAFCSKCPYNGQITSPIQLGDSFDPGKDGPIPLGYTNQGLFVFRDQIRNLISLVSSNQLLSYQHQIAFAPREFWVSRYPSKKSDYSTIAAGEAMIQACRDAGPFDPAKVRGRGVWIEKGIIIINLGDPLPDSLQHKYICFDKMDISSTSNFATEDIKTLLELFKWRNKQDAILFLGWLSIAVICGALNWRPHLFLFGPANSGKTTLHNMAVKLLTPLCVSADGQSTEAGIRQQLGPDALPIIIDEFESDHNGKQLQKIIQLARSASSAESPVLRGTPEGKALQYSIKTSFLFSAINVTGMSPADATRISMLELMAHDSNPEIGRKIEQRLSHLSEKGPEWCGYIASHANEIVSSINKFKEALGTGDSRHKLNMATLLSGAFVALHARPPEPKEIEEWVTKYQPLMETHAQSHERDDPSECLSHLFAYALLGEDGLYPLGHWLGVELKAIQDGSTGNNHIRDSFRIVSSHDMKIVLDGDKPGLLLRNGSPAIDRIFADTRWANGAWQKALGQLGEAFKLPNPIRFPGSSTKHRCVGLPLGLIPKPLANPSDNPDF